MTPYQAAYLLGYMDKEAAPWTEQSLRQWIATNKDPATAAAYGPAQLKQIADSWNKDWFSGVQNAFAQTDGVPYGGMAAGGAIGAGLGGMLGGSQGAMITGLIGTALGGIAQRFGIGIPQLMEMAQNAVRGNQLADPSRITANTDDQGTGGRDDNGLPIDPVQEPSPAPETPTYQLPKPNPRGYYPPKGEPLRSFVTVPQTPPSRITANTDDQGTGGRDDNGLPIDPVQEPSPAPETPTYQLPKPNPRGYYPPGVTPPVRPEPTR